MKVKALISFCGKISMTVGQEKDIEEGEVLDDLINAGYVEKVKKTKATASKQGGDKG